MLDGFVSLLKPPGPTSHDMVAYVRRLSGIKRAGHTGTLDPLAAGVLVIAIGRATRLIQYLDTTKTYLGEITFGLATDTLDAGGNITANEPAQFVRQDLETVLLEFTGAISQVPPMVSAVKWRGHRLYDLARKGVEVDRPARPVLIHKLKLLSFNPERTYPRSLIKCTCSAGTYVRTLAADIGTALNCSSYLSFLLRTQSGPFTISTSLTPDEFETYLRQALPSRWLCPPQEALSNLSAVALGQEDVNLFKHGNPVMLEQSMTLQSKVMSVRVCDRDGIFLGVGQLCAGGLTKYRLQPKVVFN